MPFIPFLMCSKALSQVDTQNKSIRKHKTCINIKHIFVMFYIFVELVLSILVLPLLSAHTGGYMCVQESGGGGGGGGYGCGCEVIG